MIVEEAIEWNYRKTVITGLQFTGVITGVITDGIWSEV